MSIKRSKTSALLFATVFTGFLCLFQVACQFGSNTDKDNQEPSIDPDKFGLEDPSDRSNYQKNFVEVKIIPGSPTMNVKDFFVTATIAENNGIVRGAVSKKSGTGFDYTIHLNNQSVAALSYKRDKPSGNSQVQPIKFKIQALPNKTIKKEDKYSLKITVQLQGDKQHTETKSITLTAKQDGKDCQVPIRKVDSTKDANPTATILDSSSMILSEDTPPISLAQLTAIPDHIAVAYSHSTNTEPSTPTGSHFTVKLKNKTLKGGVRNFVLVSIQPDKQGMSLRDFFVNTSMSAPGGAAMGSNRKNKQGRLVYDQPLTDCCVSGLLLDKANCLGANDTSFSRGQEIAFRIEVKPDSAIDPGAPYTLTVTVECPGNHPHTTTQSITLTAPPPSTRTTKKEH